MRLEFAIKQSSFFLFCFFCVSCSLSPSCFQIINDKYTQGLISHYITYMNKSTVQNYTDLPKSLRFLFWNIILRIKINITSATRDASETNNYTNNVTGMVCLAKRNTVYVGWDPKRSDMHMTGGRVFIFCAWYKRWTVMANIGRDTTYSWAEFMKFNQNRLTIVLKTS
jgi:hypothetical protein